MAWGYVNTQVNCIEADIVSLNAQIETVYQNLGEIGLGDIFKNAVEAGMVNEASFEGLSADIAGDLKDVFNGVALTEMVPGVFMIGGPKITITSGYKAGQALRAQMIAKLFAQAAERGNRTAIATKANLAKLAYLTEQVAILKAKKATLVANVAA